MNKLILLLCLGLLLAPAPRGIALNHETKECGGFWAGDEYGGSKLPSGWKAYYPDNQGIIHTEIGSCSFGSAQSSSSSNAESCCQELGYAYVGSNVGTMRTSPLTISLIAILVCSCLAVSCAIGLVGALVIGGGSFLWRRSRKKQ